MNHCNYQCRIESTLKILIAYQKYKNYYDEALKYCSPIEANKYAIQQSCKKMKRDTQSNISCVNY
jgi:hypothetical protein